MAIARLRETKATLGEAAYYLRLENLMLQLSKLYSEPAGKR
jgi:hypothetical protein